MANQKYKFERLTPIDNMDLDVYEEAIDYVFSNSDVKNVAISGAYSAGKSSVLASYKKKHGELRFLHISLAHFKSTDQKSNAEVKESTLEGKILNQLIHQIPSEKNTTDKFQSKENGKFKKHSDLNHLCRSISHQHYSSSFFQCVEKLCELSASQFDQINTDAIYTSIRSDSRRNYNTSFTLTLCIQVDTHTKGKEYFPQTKY